MNDRFLSESASGSRGVQDRELEVDWDEALGVWRRKFGENAGSIYDVGGYAHVALAEGLAVAFNSMFSPPDLMGDPDIFGAGGASDPTDGLFLA